MIFIGVFYLYKISNFTIDSKSFGEWSIGIYKLYDRENKDIIAIPYPGANNPVLTVQNITDRNANYVADPFLACENGNYYMFFEVFSRHGGDIGLATSKDAINWQYKRIVLDEPFHLSYPDVFKWEDNYYMIPESAEDSSVRLYKAKKFPHLPTCGSAMLTLVC